MRSWWAGSKNKEGGEEKASDGGNPSTESNTPVSASSSTPRGQTITNNTPSSVESQPR